jgi:hypothetical protein
VYKRRGNQCHNDQSAPHSIGDLTITNVSGGALAVTCYPQIRYHGETDWRSTVVEDVAATGIVTLAPRQLLFKATAALAGTYGYIYPFSLEGVDGNEFRLATITAAGAGGSDAVSIRLRVGFSGS